MTSSIKLNSITTNDMKCVIYARVSSKEQEETGYSLPAQTKILEDFASKQGFDVAKTFSISESASGSKQRTVFSEMIKYLTKQKIDLIICEKVDRITRNLKDAVEIDRWLDYDENRHVFLVKDNIDLHKNSRSQEKFLWGIRVLMAKNYTDNLSEEVKKGQKEKLDQGWLPAKPPIGYTTVGNQGHKIHVLDEAKAPLVRKMFEHYASGNYSLKSLTEKINDEGLRTTAGRKMAKSRVAEFLQDPFYYGRNRWNGEIYPVPGKQEPLLGKELFDEVQKRLHSKTTPKYRKHFYTFKGLIRCANCNGTITWEKQKGTVYGHCNHRYTKCTQVGWSREDKVEKQLVATLNKLQIKTNRLADWVSKGLKASHQDKISYRSTVISELRKREDELNQYIDTIYDDKVRGVITETKYKQKFAEYSAELESVQGKLKKHADANINYYTLGSSIYDLSQQATTIYYKSRKPEKKRQLINLVFCQMRLNNGVLAAEYTPEFKRLEQAVQKTNRSKLAKLAETNSQKFEQQINRLTKRQNSTFSATRPTLLAGSDSNRQPSD
jgi:site-specific DNA recombinase